MKILIIGGTVFLGRHLIEAALNRGHEITIFNRGLHGAELYPEVEKLRGNRVSDLSALHGRKWDAVVDTCGYVPGVVRRSAEALRDSVGHYTFISSVSVYEKFDANGNDENAPLAKLTDQQIKEAEELTTGERATAVSYGEAYGGLKALCERAAEEAMPGRVLNVRAGLIVGKYDSIERFTYWVWRVKQGGKMLCPGEPDRHVRLIDASDLARWIFEMAESRKAGTYNATGAEDGLTFGRMLGEIRDVSQSDAEFVWADEKFLEENEVGAWTEMPLWIPQEYNGIFEVKNDKAIADGLTFRPLRETIEEVLEWLEIRPPGDFRAGMKIEREKDLLARLAKN